MYSRHVPFVVAVTALAVCSVASTPRQAMDKRAREFEKAMMTKDTSWFDSVATSDFVAIDEHGKKSTRKEAMAGVTQMFQMMSGMTSCTEKILTCTVSGKTIHLTQQSKMEATIPGAGGGTSKLTDTSKSDETWVLVGTQWKIKLEKTLSDEMLVDGKKFDIGG